MKIVILCGTILGTKTKAAMQRTTSLFVEKYPDYEIVYLDLADYSLVFSDGRPYDTYEGDTKYVTKTIMEADAVVIGTPVFQASIPAPLKNIFDLLPFDAFKDKVVSIVVTAGTPRHYLMAEHQLKPILTFMKATLVPNIVFIEEKDFVGTEIGNEAILQRLEQLIDETVFTVKVKQCKFHDQVENALKN